MPIKDIFTEVMVLVSLALVMALSVNVFSPRRIAWFGNWDTSRGVISTNPEKDLVVPDFEIDNVVTAKKIYDRGNAVFVDARAEEAFDEGHIKGAVSLPVGRVNTLLNKFKAAYPSSTLIVTYCSGRECDDSHNLAQYLYDAGYTNVNVFIDGYPAWRAAGYPIAK